jgi:hypothetical protein
VIGDTGVEVGCFVVLVCVCEHVVIRNSRVRVGYMYVYVYMYMCVHVHVYLYVCMYASMATFAYFLYTSS